MTAKKARRSKKPPRTLPGHGMPPLPAEDRLSTYVDYREMVQGYEELVAAEGEFAAVAQLLDELLERPAHHGIAAADGADAQPGALPGLLELDLGHGDVEAVAQPLEQALQDAPLVLERAGVGEEQVERQDADDHGNLPRR